MTGSHHVIRVPFPPWTDGSAHHCFLSSPKPFSSPGSSRSRLADPNSSSRSSALRVSSRYASFAGKNSQFFMLSKISRQRSCCPALNSRGSSTGSPVSLATVMDARPCCCLVPCHQNRTSPRVELAQSRRGTSNRGSCGIRFGQARPPRHSSGVRHMARLWEFNRKSLLACSRDAPRFQRSTARAWSFGRGSPQESGNTTNLRSLSAKCAQSIGHVGISPARRLRTRNGPRAMPVSLLFVNPPLMSLSTRPRSATAPSDTTGSLIVCA